MDPTTAANLEVLRQRAMGGPPSGAGIPGGAAAANTPNPGNPIAMQGMATPQLPSQAPQGMSGGGSGNPFASGMAALQKSQPGEAEIIIKGLLSRLGDLPPAAGGLNA